MKSWLIMAAAAAFATGLAGAAQAGTPYPIEMKCAVGGERFTHTGTASYSTWGQRPDGKPYGSWEFPMPLPVCPGNGLVMYRDFTKPELKQLPALLASDAYKVLAGDSSYYRAAWLERSLKGDGDSLWLVLQASWQVDEDPVRKARYQREFAQGAEAEPAKPGDARWMGIQGRAANARRELGEFDAAKADLARLEIDKLVAALPTPPKEGEQEPEAVASQRGVLGYLGKLRAVVNRGDASSEPIDMVPPMVAARQCVDLEAKGQSNEACKAERVAKSMEMVRKARAERAGAGH